MRRKAAQVFAIVFLLVGVSLIWWGFRHRNDPTRDLWRWYHVHWYDGVADGTILCILGGIAFRQAFLKK